MKSRSLHIGLNKIDPKVYGTDGILAGCINDARAMQGIASNLGYQTKILLDEEATAGNVIRSIASAANELQSGDIFMLTYAGHGSQVKDITSDEPDGYDETWCLFDRLLLDDELYLLWSNFRTGVRIAVVSDSCHSGTVVREFMERLFIDKKGTPPYRFIERVVAQRVFDNFRNFYEPMKQTRSIEFREAISASIILLSGCQDNQLSSDGDGANGFFTTNLLKVWNGGSFTGNYEKFVKAIVSSMNTPLQTPNYLPVGAVNLEFAAQTPFITTTTRAPLPTFPAPHSEEMDFTLHLDRAFVLDSSDQLLEDYLRTRGVDVLIDAYREWTAAVGSIRTTRSRGTWDMKVETNTKTGQTTASGSIGGTW